MNYRSVLQGVIGIALIFGYSVICSAAQQTAPSSSREVSGRKLFLQRCSVCHLPPLGRGADITSFGPELKGKVKDAASEERVRNFVKRGTSRMPGFQYALSPSQFDDLIGYLKTL